MERPFPAYKGDAPYMFVSYSHEDDELVYPEIEWLHGEGFNIWYDEGISPGSRWSDALAKALTGSSHFVFLVTPNSAASQNCMDEVGFALERSKPLLAIHPARAGLPDGLALRLGSRQATMKYAENATAYRAKVTEALSQTILLSVPLLRNPELRCVRSCLNEVNFALSRERKILSAHLQPTELPVGRGARALLYSRAGRYEKAKRDITELSNVLPHIFAPFYHLYWRRELDAAKGCFDWLEPRRNLHPLDRIWGCVLQGDMNDALDHFEEYDARQSVDPCMLRIQTAHVLPRSIHRKFEQQPRVQAVLRRYGLDDEWRNELMGMATKPFTAYEGKDPFFS